MKAKTIKVLLRKKTDDWIATIASPEIRKLAAENTIVTGGCIASMLLQEKINDFDIYFKTRSAAEQIAKYYVDQFRVLNSEFTKMDIFVESREDRIKIVIQSAGVASEGPKKQPYQYFELRPEQEAGEYLGEVIGDPGEIEDVYEETEKMALETEGTPKQKYRPVFLSTNAITLSDKIQLVFRFFGEPDVIHTNYDFIHCTNYWTSWDGNLVLRQGALESLLARELVYVGSKYPVCSVFRLRKFIRRNWTINAGQILKILMQVSALDLTDIPTLEDQLTGVDCAYFLQVIDKLKEKDPEKVNSAYLIEIIDRMF
jgi:hypothetical protein